MRSRPIILLLLAVVLAGGTALLARSWLAAQRERAKEVAQEAPKPATQPVQSVLVARLNIGRGDILRPDQLAWQPWPTAGLNKNYVVQGGTQTPQSYAGWVAVNPIADGEPITLSKIISPKDRGFLAAVLKPGMRAISVPVTTTSGTSGFILPGDQVDVLLTYTVPMTDEHRAYKAVETVLRDVRVIGIDQRLQSKPGEAILAHTATFEVTPKQSEVIALATTMGDLSLTLRSLRETPAQQKTAAADAAHPATFAAMSGAGSRAGAEPAAASAVTVLANAPARAAPIPVRNIAMVANSSTDSPNAAAPTGGPHVVTPTQEDADTTIGERASYTKDKEVNNLLPPVENETKHDLTQFWMLKGPSIQLSHPEAQSVATTVVQGGPAATHAEPAPKK